MTEQSEHHHRTAQSVFWWLLNVTLLVLILAGIGLAKMLQAQGESIHARTITVSAAGKAVVIPDIARLLFSVVSEGKDPKALQDENTEKMNQAIGFAKGLGIADKDIQTAGYALSPKYDYDRFTGRSAIFGYTLTQTVQVKIRDFSGIGPLLGGLPEKGINQIDSLSFAVDDPDRYLNQARKEAFEKARAKANAMADNAGVRLGDVVTFSENGGPLPPEPMFALDRAGVGGGGALQSLPTVEPGSRELSVGVNVTYDLK